MTKPVWLPDILCFNGDWDNFIATVYQVFENDFKNTKPTFQGLVVNHDTNIEFGKEAGFWHIVQRDDKIAEERVPDIARCVRIPWPRPIIDNSTDADVSVWENERKKSGNPRQKRMLIWFEAENYLVVLTVKPRYAILVTAYCVDNESYRNKLRKERDEYYIKQKTP